MNLFLSFALIGVIELSNVGRSPMVVYGGQVDSIVIQPRERKCVEVREGGVLTVLGRRYRLAFTLPENSGRSWAMRIGKGPRRDLNTLRQSGACRSDIA